MDPLDQLMHTIGRLNRWGSRQADLGVTHVTARLLVMIEEFEPARISTLAKADGVAQPTMTTHVQRLVDAGLVTRVPDPADARAVLVSLTDAGRRTLEHVREARTRTLARHIADLDEPTRQRIADAAVTLQDLLRHVNGESPASRR